MDDKVEKYMNNIKNVINDFSDVEKDILIDRFGINDEIVRSYKEVQEKYNISKDEIMKIEARCIREAILRNRGENSKILKDYLD